MTRSKALTGLVVLNAALAGVLVWKLSPENPAHAQANPARGEYLMVPARVTGFNNGVVYVLDTRNEALGGFAYNENRRAIEAMPGIDLRRVFDAGAGVGGGRR